LTSTDTLNSVTFHGRERKQTSRDASSRMIIDEYVMRDVMPCGRLKTLPPWNNITLNTRNITRNLVVNFIKDIK